MIINSEIANLQNSPGIQANTAANKPAANNVGIGTIYVSTDTGSIERSNGTTWLNLGGGVPVVTPGIDDVLSVNQALTGTQSIELANNQFAITDSFASVYQFNPDGDFIVGKSGEATLNYEINPGSFEFYFQTPGGANGLSIDTNVNIFQFGDFDNQNNGNYFQITDQNNLIFFGNGGNTDGLSFDMANQVYDIGNLTTNLTGFRIDDGNEVITAQTTAGANGLKLDFNSSNRFYAFGDFAGLSNSTKLLLDDLNTIVTLNADAEIIFDTQKLNFPDPNIITASSGGNSGQHLKVTVNGSDYVIKLENP
jgi:hypothetical protein